MVGEVAFRKKFCVRHHLALAAVFGGNFSVPDSISPTLGWRLKGHHVPQQ